MRQESSKSKAAVIGGGMAGISAAILLAQAGIPCVLFERQDRIAKKLLLTGNGRCNLSNESVAVSDYVCDDAEKLNGILSAMTMEMRDNFYKSCGIQTIQIRDCIYPVTKQASSVVDAFRFRLSEIGVDIRTQTLITGIGPDRRLQYADGRKSESFRYILAAGGGKAGVYDEENNNCFSLLKKLGHKAGPTHPGLTFVKCREDMKNLAGVRTEAGITLRSPAGTYSEYGELQLTKDGLSGIPVFQLTRYMDHAADCQFEVDFLPFLSSDAEAKERLKGMPGRIPEEFFAGWLNKKIVGQAQKAAGIKANAPLDPCSLQKLLTLLRHFPFQAQSLGSYRNAQLMCGGISLKEIDPWLESCFYRDLFLLGELLDVNGACGGYNLHFALACAMRVVERIIAKENTRVSLG